MPPAPAPARVGYLMSWYPAPTETFILHEMLELRRLGVDLEIFPLFGAAGDLRHPGAEALADRVRYPGGPGELLRAQLHWLRRRPRAYLAAWAGALAGNARSPAFLAKALWVVPRAAEVARRLEERGVRHVHAHWATHPALAAWVVGRLTGVGYSFTAHAHDLYLDRAMLREKLAEARFAVTISRFNRALLARLYGPAAVARTVVIPCGVDPRLFRPRAPRAPDGLFRVACVAGLRDYKGHRFLLDAVALLRDRGVPVRCELAGDGPERRALQRRAAALRLGDRVAFRGAEPQDRVSALLAASDAMALPSVVTPEGMMDGIPVALMEAMAMGVPVVATRVSGIPELVEDGRTGLLAPPRDPAALAAALERLHRDPALAARLGAAGRARVLARYDLRRSAARLRALLAAAAEGRALPGEAERRLPPGPPPAWRADRPDGPAAHH